MVFHAERQTEIRNQQVLGSIPSAGSKPEEELAPHLVVLHGSMAARGRIAATDQLAASPSHEERLVLAPGRYVGEGSDDARLDTLSSGSSGFLEGHARAVRGTASSPPPRKTEVCIFDYVDRDVPMLLRMFEKRLRGYRAIGYARGQAPLGSIEPTDDIVVEYEGAT